MDAGNPICRLRCKFAGKRTLCGHVRRLDPNRSKNAKRPRELSSGEIAWLLRPGRHCRLFRSIGISIESVGIHSVAFYSCSCFGFYFLGSSDLASSTSSSVSPAPKSLAKTRTFRSGYHGFFVSVSSLRLAACLHPRCCGHSESCTGRSLSVLLLDGNITRTQYCTLGGKKDFSADSKDCTSFISDHSDFYWNRKPWNEDDVLEIPRGLSLCSRPRGAGS